MASSDSETDQQHPIWELVSLSDYRPPSAPTATSARRGLLSLKRLFGRGQQKPQGPVKSEHELHVLEPKRLDAVAGAIDWRSAAQVLQSALEQRSAADPVWLIISPPAAGFARLLETWAVQQEAACISSPNEEILMGDHSGWLADLPDSGAPWVLPRLERCWLRHPAGLELVRDLFDRLLSGKLGFALIGCDSWSWAYLRFVVPTSMVRVLTFQAFDGERLAAWLAELAAAEDGHPCRFRHAQSGNLLLSVNDDEPQQGVGTELRYLAAQSRGNAAAALRLWRSRLRSEPEAPEATEEVDLEQDVGPATRITNRATDTTTKRTTEQDGAEVIWVAPAVDLSLPSGLDEPEALLLHALLLHEGVTAPTLETLLPHTRFRTRALLQQLAAADVVMRDEDDARWRVSVFAYPAVRTFLAGRDFLTDDC
ncbi:MAG: hypothetical protein VBE63_20090 [Lamprobacter sp.]|uniref:hypothetical protein n=1 Tax=Lamprobacter sp. TaxID=3100796 RepID=UPI002B263572|nr:hypothetical protein [Lamprobacter sp.]MEA3642219.1 hypothetical protein [Lamprobacter sp.]